jgi:hypothetical protein
MQLHSVVSTLLLQRGILMSNCLWRLLIIGLALTPAGCMTTQQAPQQGPPVTQDPGIDLVSPTVLTDSQLRSIHQAVREKLKDPESARFGRIVAGKDTKDIISVCGLVNARNGFGGYTGETPFLGIFIGNATKSIFFPVKIGGAGFDTPAVISVCKQKGLAL